jgi:WD40 repeat protein
LSAVPTTMVLNVLNEVSRFVADRLGLTLDVFMAVLKNPLAVEDGEVLRQSRPFGLVAAEILRRLGREYEGLALELELANRQAPSVNSGAVAENELSDTWNCVRSFSGHTSNVTCVAFSPDGKFIVSSSDDATIRLWDIREGREVWIYSGHTSLVHCVAFSPDGKFIASASADCTSCLIDQKGQLFLTFKGHTRHVNAVAFSPDSQLVASASADGTVKIWDIFGQEIQAITPDTSIDIRAVVFTKDGRQVIFGGLDGSIYSALLSTKVIQVALKIHDTPIYSLSLHPSSTLIASSGEDTAIKISDLDGNVVSNPFMEHENIIWSVAFSPDGKILASGSRDRTIHLWDAEGNPVNAPLIRHLGGVNCVTFSPNSKILASCGSDNKIKLWSRYPASRLPFRKMSDFADCELLQTCNGTTINVLRTNAPWKLPFDMLVIPVSPNGHFGGFGLSFEEYINSIPNLSLKSFSVLMALVSNERENQSWNKIEPHSPLVFALPLEISQNMFFSHKPILVACVTAKSVDQDRPDIVSIAVAARAIIDIASERGCKNLILPLIGTGIERLDALSVAVAMIKSINLTLRELEDDEIEEITIVEKEIVKIGHIKNASIHVSANKERHQIQSKGNPISVFVSYCHEDLLAVDRLTVHLSSMRREGKITMWHDRNISAGSEWGKEISRNLEESQIILLLVSADFLNSEYCYGIEMESALEQHKKGEACVVPIILRPCFWNDSPFAKLQVLPSNGVPVSSWSDQDSAFLSISNKIRNIVDDLEDQKMSTRSEN